MEFENPMAQWLSENWEIVFLYLFKQLSDIKTRLEVHSTEIENLKA